MCGLGKSQFCRHLDCRLPNSVDGHFVLLELLSELLCAVFSLCSLIAMNGENRGTCCVAFGVRKRMTCTASPFNLLGNASEGIFMHLEV